MKVLNFGSLNIDYVYGVDHFVKKGETISSRSLHVYSGGKGLNQSVALAKAGADVYHAGAIGKDGMFLIDVLKEAGADTTNILIQDEPRTGNAIIQNDVSGDNCILLFGGANRSIKKEYIDTVLNGFEKGDYLILQNEINNNAYIIEEAHKKGMIIILNPSPLDEEVKELPLEYVDYFLLNEVEAAGLSGLDPNDLEAQQKLLHVLHEKFKNAGILITLGEKGSIYSDGNKTIKQEAIKVKAVDTTAAGDTFTGYFVEGLVRGEDMYITMNRASIAAAIAVTGKGAAPSIPGREEVEERI
ncbi:MAG: ribokinase [Lachnospiraceae bacterium]|nr:ribokinase [Lachnospiraceae bacterium]